MKAEIKLQTDVIKGNRMYYKQYEEMILISEGHYGVYLKPNELKIDKSKMIEFGDKTDTLDPKKLEECRTKAKITNTAIKTHSGFAIKIKSLENDEYCFVDEKFLKQFPGHTNVLIKSRKEPILILKYGLPYGIILPMNITTELE